MVDTLNRLDGARAAFGVKKPVRAATTENITLSGFQTIDGAAFSAGDEAAGYNMRVLVKNQTAAAQNGIYYVTSSDWARTKDFDGNTDFVEGTLIVVQSGTVNAGVFFRVDSADPPSVGTDDITFARYRLDDFLNTATVESAATVDLSSTDGGTTDGELVTITGTETITRITIPAGAVRIVLFAGIMTLTHNATFLQLPGGSTINAGQNIVTRAGDWGMFAGDGIGARCVFFMRKDGEPLVTGDNSLASGSSINLGSIRDQSITITGSTGISSFGSTAPTGAIKFLTFAAALTITHNAASLICPGGQNIRTAAGDSLIAKHEGSGNWRIVAYSRAAGAPQSLLSINTGSVSNSSTAGAEEDLISYALPAGRLASSSHALHVKAWGVAAATTTAKRARLYFGGTAIADTGAIPLNGGSWLLDATVARTSSTAAQKAVGTAMFSSSPVVSVTAPAESPLSTSSIEIKVTGLATSSTGDITASALSVEMLSV